MISSVASVLKDQKISSSDDLIDLTRNGLQAKYVSTVMEYTGMSNKELADVLPFSERQLVRYTADKFLNPEITERLLQLIELHADGYDLFNIPSEFQRWLRTENLALDHKHPITYLDTAYGIRLIKAILGRIRHGVFS